MATEEVKSGKLRVIAHISAQSLQESIELARHAASTNCDVVCSVTVTYVFSLFCTIWGVRPK